MRLAGKSRKQKSGVLICGAYGMRNAGDEAVLDAILAELRELDPDLDITVLSRSPEETQAHHGAVAQPGVDPRTARRGSAPHL